MIETHPFNPIVDSNTRILFLGSFPSLTSVEHSFYYAHPRNSFWPILESIFAISFKDNLEKRAFCLEMGIGLWDVIASCERKDSSDTNLKHCIPNDFNQLLRDYPLIESFAFTGKKSHDLYMKYFKHLDVEYTLLPSTSPAHAAMPFEAKKESYAKFLRSYEII